MSQPRLLADHDLNEHLVRGVVRREPAIEFIRARAIGMHERSDAEVRASAEDAQAQHMRLEVVKRPEAKKGLVLLPRRWVVERSNAWAARFHRLARDYERLAETLAGLHFVALAILMLKRFVELRV